jgi:hypothetical protein
VSFSVARGLAGRLLAAGTSSAAFSDNGNIRGLQLSPPSRKSLYGLPTASSEQPHRQQHHDRQEATTMPFGKHNGQSLRCIFDTDKQYLVCCLSQSLFRTTFVTLFDIYYRNFSIVVVNNGRIEK